MLSDRCLSVLSCPACLSVTFVHCGHTVGRIKMKLDVQVGLAPGHIVLDGDPAPPSQRGTAPTQFSAHICCGQMAAWTKMPLGISPGDFVLDGDPALPSLPSPPPQFSAHFYWCQMAACIKMPLGTEVGLSPVDFVLDGDPAPSLNFWPMFIIVIVISLEHCTMHSCYWLVQVQVLVFYAFCF